MDFLKSPLPAQIYNKCANQVLKVDALYHRFLLYFYYSKKLTSQQIELYREK